MEAIKTQEKNEWTRNISQQLVAFEKVKYDLCYAYNDYCGEFWMPIANEKIKLHPVYKEINVLLSKFLKLELALDKPNNDEPQQIFISFKKLGISGGGTEDIWDLSAGQKWIIHLIFSLFWYNLEEGLIIIDEPEIHLHPTFQKEYLEVLEDISKNYWLQVVLVTHSPSFINARVIKNVHRFRMSESGTKVSFPNSRIETTSKTLFQIIHYTNSEKIFFADKVLLVEGDSDEYFFRNFWEKYKKEHELDLNLEIVFIGWKKNYNNWRELLAAFDIQNYYLGDWDNIYDLAHLTLNDAILKDPLYAEFQRKKNLIDQKFGGSLDGNQRKTKKQEIYSTLSGGVVDIISQLANEKVFILREWELEDYLWQEWKLEMVIKFCEESLDSWYSTNNDKQRELKDIFNKITINLEEVIVDPEETLAVSIPQEAH